MKERELAAASNAADPQSLSDAADVPTPTPGWRGALLCLLLVPLASLWDRSLSGFFWHPDEGFFLAHLWPLELVYHGTRWVMDALVSALLLALISSYVLQFAELRKARAKLWFAILALAIGPGLITHNVLKNHWGRARPAQIAEFGGSAQYTPPWQPGSQCQRNCSFPSGHAVAGFSLITSAWLWPHRRRRWLLIGIATGAAIGLVRIAQGGHFISDVMGSLAVVWLTNVALCRLINRQSARLKRVDSPR